MTHATQPNLNELMANFLARQQADRAMGAELTVGGEVEAYEAVPAQAVDPRMAWDASAEVLALVAPKNTKLNKLPTGWSQLVAGLESACALPMAVGNFPQAVRDLLPLVRADKLSNIVEPKRAVDETSVSNWIETASKSDDAGKWLLAAAMLRLTGKVNDAVRLLQDKQNSVSPEWKAAVTNEAGALAWSRGDREAAVKVWNTLPNSVTRSFNLGMAALFTDQTEVARTHLQAAAKDLSETSAWHHLARLYLALAENR